MSDQDKEVLKEAMREAEISDVQTEAAGGGVGLDMPMERQCSEGCETGCSKCCAPGGAERT